MTPKEIGDDAENYFLQILKKLGDNPKLTKGSGSVRSEPDIISDNMSAEVKGTESESFTINPSIVKKLVKQSVSNNGINMLCVKTKSFDGVLLPTADFIVLYTHYINSVKEQKR